MIVLAFTRAPNAACTQNIITSFIARGTLGALNCAGRPDAQCDRWFSSSSAAASCGNQSPPSERLRRSLGTSCGRPDLHRPGFGRGKSSGHAGVPALQYAAASRRAIHPDTSPGHGRTSVEGLGEASVASGLVGHGMSERCSGEERPRHASWPGKPAPAWRRRRLMLDAITALSPRGVASCAIGRFSAGFSLRVAPSAKRAFGYRGDRI
jgi:hypothetical protein